MNVKNIFALIFFIIINYFILYEIYKQKILYKMQ